MAHQCLVGRALLEYKDAMRPWPLDRQATAYRGMVFLQTDRDAVLAGAAGQLSQARAFIAAADDRERIGMARGISAKTARDQTATVSYVGKANYREAERYIRDLRTWTCGECPVLIEISAVNGQFILDFNQQFSSPVCLNAFLSELDGSGITYDLRDGKALILPNVRLPWSE